MGFWCVEPVAFISEGYSIMNTNDCFSYSCKQVLSYAHPLSKPGNGLRLGRESSREIMDQSMRF